MPNEVRDAVKNAADQIAKYIQNAATMTVQTKYVEMGSVDFKDAKLAASTTVQLDGDSETVLPMRKTDTGSLEVDTAVYELHQQNVQTAIDYRAKILNSLITLLHRSSGTGGGSSLPPSVGAG